MAQPTGKPKTSVLAPLTRHATACVAVLLLVFGCVAIYLGTLDFDFVAFDDNLNLLLNGHHGSPSLGGLRWMFTESGTMLRYLPLSWLLWSLVHAWTGLAPLGYHAANVALHAMDTVLLYLVLRQILLLGQGTPVTREESQWGEFCAFAGAALWSWHPLRVELVAWSSGLLYLHACFWLLLAVWCQLKAVTGFRNTGHWGIWLWLALACQAASLASYPLILCFPAIPAVLLLWLTPGRGSAGGRWRGVLASTAISGAFGVIAVAIRLLHAPASRSAAGLAEFPLHQRLEQACYVLMHGLWTTLAPFGLTPVRADLVDSHSTDPGVLAGVVTALLLVAACWLLGRRNRALWWLGLAYLALQLPFLGFFEHPHVPCDRYTHLPGLVLACGAMLALARASTPRARIAAAAGAGLLLLASQTLSREQCLHWRNTDTLFARIIGGLKGTPRVQEGYRTYYLDSLAMEGHGRTEISPLSKQLFKQADVALSERRMWDCEQRLRKALAYSPAMTSARYNLAQLLASRGEPREAAAHYLVLKAQGKPAPDKLRVLLLRVQESARMQDDVSLAKALQAELGRGGGETPSHPIS